MTITPEQVLRRFLRIEATRPEYHPRMAEILGWCELPDAEFRIAARRFGDERKDVNPVFVHTVGHRRDDRSTRIKSWTRRQIDCRNIFTNGIGSHMAADLKRVQGNLRAFALGFAAKYAEFQPLRPLHDLAGTVIVLAHGHPGSRGAFEVIDGAHRLVALCRAKNPDIPEIEAYVGQLKS